MITRGIGARVIGAMAKAAVVVAKSAARAAAAISAKRVRVRTLVMAAILATILMGLRPAIGEAIPILRDAFVAVYAHRLAGDKIPFVDDDYSYSRPQVMWGISTNSPWLAGYTLKIVPFFAYEGVRLEGRYPEVVIFAPGPDEASLHVLGRAFCAGGDIPPVVIINERIVTDSRYNDARVALATLVHELVHIQQGAFCSGSSEELEAKTEAAATEVLAAMCNYGDVLACQTFWKNISDLAEDSLRVKLWRKWGERGDHLYQAFANLFLRNSKQEISAEKAMRFWMRDEEHKEALQGILFKYGEKPWHIVVGAASGKDVLLTGFPIARVVFQGGRPVVVYDPPTWGSWLPFDDTRALLVRGGLGWLVALW